MERPKQTIPRTSASAETLVKAVLFAAARRVARGDGGAGCPALRGAGAAGLPRAWAAFECLEEGEQQGAGCASHSFGAGSTRARRSTTAVLGTAPGATAPVQSAAINQPLLIRAVRLPDAVHKAILKLGVQS